MKEGRNSEDARVKQIEREKKIMEILKGRENKQLNKQNSPIMRKYVNRIRCSKKRE